MPYGWIFAYIIGQVCFCMHLYGPKTFVDNFKWLLSEASGQVLLKFHAEPLWAGERKIAKMYAFHLSKWLPCPYMVKTFKNLLQNKYALSPNLCTNYRGQEIYHNCYNEVLCWRLTFLPPRSNLLPNAFVWAIYIYIGSIEVTCRSAVAKVVLIGLCLLYFSATVLFTCIKS